VAVAIAERRPGERVAVGYLREGETRSADVVLRIRPAR
jgi:hypothetical protein